MASTQDIEIIEGYRKELASPMAAMFNTWDELWPGGFNQGVPLTPERVDKDFGSQRVLAQLIAWDSTNKEAVGYCSLLEHWRDTDAAYIGLLGVSPHVLGKKVGKQLLLRSIEIATKKGFKRVDLHTWAGNLRAVPLYKKIGLMWDPEGEGVHMRGYIPGILQHPLCASFFAVHDVPLGWYEYQQRDLTQAPDDMQRNGMKVFVYKFLAGSDELEVTVDRYASAISGVDSTINGKRLKVEGRVKDHLVFCGIPSEYLLVIENDSDEPCPVSVQLEGFSGLDFHGSLEHSLVVPANDSATLTVPFSLDASTPLFRKDFKSPMITAHLELNGTKAQLHTGLKIQSAAEIQMPFGYCRVVSGGEMEYPITIQNNTTQAFEGSIEFHLPDAPLTLAPVKTDVKIKPEGVAGLSVKIVTDTEMLPGTYDVWASIHLHSTKERDISLTTRKFRIPVFNVAQGHVAIGEDDRQRQVIVAGKTYLAQLAREGGTVTIAYPFGVGGNLFLRTEIGPPFGLSPFRFAEQDVSVNQTESTSIVTLSADHFERPLRVETQVIFDHHSPIISQETWVTNRGSESHTFQLRLVGPGGITISSGRTVLPLTSGFIEDRLSSVLASYPAIPSNPEDFKETWIASIVASFSRGQVWNPEHVEEIRVSQGRIGMLSYQPITLTAGERRRISQVAYVTRVENWEAVRRVWQETVDLGIPLLNEEISDLETSPMIQISPKGLIVPCRESIHQENWFQYKSTSPQSGELHIEPPPGWTGNLRLDNGSSWGSSVLLENVTAQNIPRLHLTLTPEKTIADQFAIFEGRIRWKIPVEEEQSFHIVQLGSAKDAVEIVEEEDEKLASFRITNGLLTYRVSAEFGGCLYSLKNAIGTELLRSAFPTPTPNVFQQNYHGGWQPFVSDIEDDIFQAPTNQEKMQAKICEAGNGWRGVEVKWKGKLQPCCRGVDFVLQYLTMPGSPLILSNWKIRNSTTAPLRFLTLQSLDPAFNGDLSNSVLRARWGGTLPVMRGSSFPVVFMPDANYAWLQQDPEKSKRKEGIAILNSGLQPSILILLINEVSWPFASNELFLQAKEERTLRSALFVNPPDEFHIQAIQCHLERLI